MLAVIWNRHFFGRFDRSGSGRVFPSIERARKKTAALNFTYSSFLHHSLANKTMVAGPTLTYFPVPARAEIARLAFTLGKINFVVSVFLLSLELIHTRWLSKKLAHRSATLLSCSVVDAGQARNTRGMGSPEVTDPLRPDPCAGGGRPPHRSERSHW